MKLSSTAFAPGGAIPRKFTGEGEDLSPALAWSDPPPSTKEFVLIVDDPDAPTASPWVHWVAYQIAAERRGIDEAATDGFLQGRNDFGERDYGGPMPPKGHGTHHYHFTLYAIDTILPADSGLTKNEVLRLIEGHILAQAELIGTYERK